MKKVSPQPVRKGACVRLTNGKSKRIVEVRIDGASLTASLPFYNTTPPSRPAHKCGCRLWLNTPDLRKRIPAFVRAARLDAPQESLNRERLTVIGIQVAHVTTRPKGRWSQ